MKLKTLSDKTVNTLLGKNISWIKTKDVKEFIKQETYLLGNLEREEITFDEFWEKRNKLLGEDLI